MPDLATITGLSPDALTHLQDIPAQVEQLASTAENLLSGLRDGTSTANPVGALFSGLTSLASDAAAVPGLGDVVAQIEDVLGALPSSALAEVETIGRAIEDVLALLGPLRDVLASGGLESAVAQAAAKAVDSIGQLSSADTDVASVLGEVTEFIRLFEAMVGWADAPPSSEAVVDLLTRALVGTSADLLTAPAAALDRAIAPLQALVPDGPDRTLWRGLPGDLKVAFDDLAAGVAGGVSWPDTEAAVGRIRGQLEAGAAARDRLAMASVSAVVSVDLSGLAGVASALRAVPPVTPVQLTPILDGLRGQLTAIVAELEGLSPTPDQVRTLARELVGRFVDFIDASPIGQLRAMLVNAQERFLREIEGLPFGDVAHEAQAALLHLASTLDVIDPEAVRRPVREFFDQLDQRIAQLSGDAVKQALQQLWSQVEDVVNQVSGLVQQASATITGAVDHLAGFVGDASSSLQQVNKQVETVKAAIEGFDLQPATDAVVDAFHALRDKVADLHVEELPAPARVPLQAAAEAVRQIDVTAEVSGPLDQALGRLDPTAAIRTVAGSLEQFVAGLRSLDPAALAGQLDAPVDAMLSALSQFGPDQFKGLIEQALQPVADAIRSIDAAELLRPVLRLAAELTAKVDSLLDPDVIFGPLEDLFKPVTDAIDAIAPARLIDLLTPHAGPAGQGAAAVAGPPAAFTGAGALLRDALPAGPEAADELFGFRPGDLLVPLIDIHRKLMATFGGLADTVLDQAGTLLHDVLYGRLQSLHPVSVEARIGAGLGAVLDDFDAAAVSARLAEAADAYVSAARAIAAAATSRPAQDQAVADRVVAAMTALDPLALVPDVAQADTVRDAVRWASDRVDVAELRLSFTAVGPDLLELLPDLFRTASLDAAAIRQALAALDPSPVRQQVNDLFDQAGQRVVGLSEALLAGVDEMGKAVEDFLVPVTPAHLAGLASQLHAAVKEQLLALGPAAQKEAVRPVFDTVKRQLSVIDPSFLVPELNGLRDQLAASVAGLADGFVPDRGPFDELQVRVAALKPSQILAPLVDRLKPVSDFIDQLDPAAILQPIIDAFAQIRAGLPDKLRQVEDAVDEVLAALEGGGGGGSESGGTGVSLG
jgi:hypothetical protein